MARLYANNASTTLASNISDSATSLTVATGDGALFPALSGGDTFVVTLEQGSTREIVEVTARSGDALTIVRAREGTTAAAFTAGAVVELRVTASSFRAPIVVSGGTVTASDPVIDTTQTWNNAAQTFIGALLSITRLAAGVNSDAFRVDVNGSQCFRVLAVGSIDVGNWRLDTHSVTNTLSFSISGERFRVTTSGVDLGANNVRFGASFGSADVAILRNAAGVVEINNGTAGTFRDLRLRTVRTEATTVASLVAAATAGAGARAFVTDATATTFMSTVAGGGSNAVPVVSDGTNWLIG